MTRILVIEDDPAILRGLTDALTSEGYEVLAARDGKKALDLGLRETMDLIVLDLMLPGINGFDLCKKFREDRLNVPILILSARSREADKVVGLELGADDYVTKPFGVAELLARIKALLRRGSQPSPRKLRSYSFGEIDLDFERLEAARKGKPFDLTAREFALLAWFIQHRGKVVSREQLLTSVWKHETAPVTRTVDTHIAQLRKKIEKDPARPKWIVSLRSAGYRFEG